MIKFFKGWFGDSGNASAPAKEQPAVEYKNCHISPCPRNSGGNWSTEAVIRKSIDGQIKQHTFIRADSSPSQEAATALIINKAKTLIDQQGERIFS